MSSPTYDQSGYRFRNDDEGEATATWAAALNTTATLTADVIYRVRFEIDNDAGSKSGAFSPRIQYSTGIGGWDDVSAGVAIAPSLSDWFADGDATTQQISSGNFNAGEMCEDNATNADLPFPIGYRTEVEFAFVADSAQLSDGNQVELRVVNDQTGSTIDAYSQTASFKVFVESAVEITASANPSRGLITEAGSNPTLRVINTLLASLGENSVIGSVPALLVENILPVSRGTIETTGFAPSVSSPSATETLPGVGIVNLNGKAPEATTGRGTDIFTHPGLLGYGIADYAPFSDKSRTVFPTHGLIVTNGQAPTVATGTENSVGPARGLIVTNGLAPTVSVTMSNAINPDKGLDTLSGFAPDIGVINTLAPATGNEIISGLATTMTFEQARTIGTVTGLGLFGYGVTAYPTFQPKVAGLKTALPATGEIVTNGFSPTLEVENTLPSSAGDVITLGFTPLTAVLNALQPGKGLVTVNGQSPLTGTLNTLDGVSGDIITQGKTPAVENENEIAPSRGLVEINTFAGTVSLPSGAQGVSPDKGLITQSGSQPVISTINDEQPDKGLVVVNGQAPTAQAVSAGTALPDKGLIVTEGQVPVLTIANTEQPDTGLIETTGFSPSVGFENTIQPDQGLVITIGSTPKSTLRLYLTRLGLFGYGSQSYETFAPKSYTAQEVNPDKGLIVTNGLIPTLVNEGTQSPSVGVITTEGQAPALTVTNEISPSKGTINQVSLSVTVQQGRYQITRLGLFGYGAKYETFSPKGFTAQEVFPSGGVIEVNGFAPSASPEGIQQPGTGLVTINGLAPALGFDKQLSPDKGLLETAGFVPDVEASSRPKVTGLGLFGYAAPHYNPFTAKPFSGSVTVLPGRGLNTFFGLTPPQAVTVSPATGENTTRGVISGNTWFNDTWFNQYWFNGFWWGLQHNIVSVDVSYYPSTNIVRINGLQPQVEAPIGTIEVTPGRGFIYINGQTTVASPGSTTNPEKGVINSTGFAPSVTKENGAWPDKGLIEETGLAPTVQIQRPNALLPQLGLVTTEGKIAQITFETVEISPENATLTIEGKRPSVAEVFLYPSGDRIQITGLAPGVDTRYWVPTLGGIETWTPTTEGTGTWSAVSQGTGNWTAAAEGTASWSAVAQITTNWN